MFVIGQLNVLLRVQVDYEDVGVATLTVQATSRRGQIVNQTQAIGTVDQFYDDLVEEKRRITGDVEEENYEKNSGFLRELATRVVMHRL